MQAQKYYTSLADVRGQIWIRRGLLNQGYQQAVYEVIQEIPAEDLSHLLFEADALGHDPFTIDCNWPVIFDGRTWEEHLRHMLFSIVMVYTGFSI